MAQPRPSPDPDKEASIIRLLVAGDGSLSNRPDSALDRPERRQQSRMNRCCCGVRAGRSPHSADQAKSWILCGLDWRERRDLNPLKGKMLTY
jgi:hypothetical protein